MEYSRQHPRLSVKTELWIGQDGIFIRSDERLADLSLGGAFIETSQFYSVGSILNLRFKLPQHPKFVTCTAIVRNTHAGSGFGVQFLDLSPEDHSVICTYLENQMAYC